MVVKEESGENTAIELLDFVIDADILDLNTLL